MKMEIDSNKCRVTRKLACRSRHRLLSILRDSEDLKQRVLSAAAPLLATTSTATTTTHAAGRAENWPWLPNKHCGSWYLPPAEWSATNREMEVYFKSTDGHVGAYAMSLKRLNLSLIEILHEHGGCVLVDSSVRKILPDSFSRTIPIWCSVMNRIALKYRTELGLRCEEEEWDTRLRTPSSIVSPEEYIEISNLIDSRVELLYRSKAIVDISRFVNIMTKPIRAVWVANGSVMNDTIIPCTSATDAAMFFTIVCCNPSHYNTDGGNITCERSVVSTNALLMITRRIQHSHNNHIYISPVQQTMKPHGVEI